MIDQETIAAALRARLPEYVVHATQVTSDLLTDVTGAIILTLVSGAVERLPLTAQGKYSRFHFDVLIYFNGTTAATDDAALRADMARAEAELADLVIAEGGNKNGWNSLDYDTESTNSQIELMAQQLDAVRVVPLVVTVF